MAFEAVDLPLPGFPAMVMMCFFFMCQYHTNFLCFIRIGVDCFGMKPITAIFIGPQGSGKGTQIELLKAQLTAHDPDQRITHIQTGKPFRDLAATGGYMAEVVKGLINSGTLVPNVLTNALVVHEFIEQHTKDAHIVFDGYPRDAEQAAVCSELFALCGRDSLQIVHLDTSTPVVVERMLERGRADDTEAIIEERLRQYHAVTEPLLEFYRAQPTATVHSINGDGTEDEVHQAIATALNLPTV